MLADVLYVVSTALAHVGDWFGVVLASVEGVEVYIGLITVVLVVKFFIVPIFGAYASAGSDSVKSRRNGGKK